MSRDHLSGFEMLLIWALFGIVGFLVEWQLSVDGFTVFALWLAVLVAIGADSLLRKLPVS